MPDFRQNRRALNAKRPQPVPFQASGPFAWLTPEEAATRLRVSLRTFKEWDIPAHELPGTGRAGQPIKRYRTVDVDAWASQYFAHGAVQKVG